MPTFFDHEALTRARTGLELTQEEAASAVGVDVRTWRRYESGEVNDPTAGFEVRNASRRRFIERVKRELGLTEHELLVERGSPVEPAGHVLQPARHFVGRAVELDALRAQIADPAVHLVAVIGPGGAGKTALVRELARGAASSWAWSFYEDPDAEACVAALEAFRGAVAVLDGLEAVQSEGRGQRSLGARALSWSLAAKLGVRTSSNGVAMRASSMVPSHVLPLTAAPQRPAASHKPVNPMNANPAGRTLPLSLSWNEWTRTLGVRVIAMSFQSRNAPMGASAMAISSGTRPSRPRNPNTRTRNTSP